MWDCLCARPLILNAIYQGKAVMKKAWDVLIDVVTLVWLVVFGLDLAGVGGGWLGWASAAIGAVFVVDLVVIFRGSAGVRDFFRRAWLDLLLLIPFFRIFRIGRVARLFRVNRLARLLRRKKMLSRIFRVNVMEACLEALDLVQKLFERIARLRFFRRL